MKTRAAAVLMAVSLVALTCSKHEDARLYKPSEITSRIMDSVMAYVRLGDIYSLEQFNAARARFALGLVDSMTTAETDRKEMLEKARILYWSGRKEEGKTAFRELCGAGDKISGDASLELIKAEIEDGEWEKAEASIKERRKSHRPTKDDPIGMWECIDDLAGRLNNADRPDDAIRLLMDEIISLPGDHPYTSYSLVEEIAPLMIETERIGELRGLTEKVKEGLSKGLADHLAEPEPADSTIDNYKAITKNFNSAIQSLDDLLTRLDLIGKKAPSIDILQVFGVDSTFTVDRFRGRITVMDFWATWCIACIMGYRELGEIYSEVGERDMAVVGITRFQGWFSDPSSGSCGNKNDTISREKEIELTAGYIERNKITWPCVITDEAVFDQLYHINNLPTCVVLDKDGVIRYIQSAIGKRRQLQRVIERLREAGK